MPFFSGFFSGKGSLGRLFARHLLLFALVFALLEIWRPCYFMTDDNLCGFFPYLTEMGRHIKEGRSPFLSDYLFGGHYLMLRDISFLYWHPFYVLPTLLADTPARFCIMEVIAGLLLLFGLAGFTLLAWRLRAEWNPALPDFHLTFYTFSFFFSTFLLTAGASWINFHGSASALPWLMLGLLERRIPVFGICFGNQILGRALGFGTYKLKYGHRGINQPVQDRQTGKVEITAHNHGFAVDAPTDRVSETPFGRVEVSHVNLNDDVVEGLACLDVPAFSVQYHPEAAAGPHDAAYLFDRFVDLMADQRKGGA